MSRNARIFSSLCLAGIVQCGFGAGYDVPDQTTRAMGMTDAFIAGADDASAVYYNPAGLTAVEDRELIGNLYLSHTVIDADLRTGGTEESDNDVYLTPNLFYAQRLKGTPELVLGLGIYAPYGQGIHWDEGDAPKTTGVFKEGDITFVNVNPSLAWGINEEISVAVGVNAAWSEAEIETGSTTNLSGNGDGTAYGWNAGLQWRVAPRWQVGFTYRSSMEMEYEGDIPAVLGDSITIDFPQSVGAGVEFRPVPALRLEASAIWKEWSSVESIMPGGDQWDDNWTFMVGGEYELAPRWTLRGGYGFSQQPKPDGELTINKDDSHAFSLGVSRRIGERWTVDVAFLLAIGEEQRVDRSALPPNFAYEADYSSVGYSLATGVRYSF